MAETVHLRIAGGVQEYDLPLHWTIQEQLDKGLIARVNADGTPWTQPAPAPEVNSDEVPTGTVAAVLGWVGDDRERAARALEVESAAEKPRTTLVGALEALATEPDEEE